MAAARYCPEPSAGRRSAAVPSGDGGGAQQQSVRVGPCADDKHDSQEQQSALIQTTFQPLSGPGFKFHKRGATVAKIHAEIERRIAAMTLNPKFTMPAIVPAYRGRYDAAFSSSEP
jgi:hypothetical protein